MALWDLSFSSRNHTLCPLLWKHRGFTTGPPGKSLNIIFIYQTYSIAFDNISPSSVVRIFFSFLRKCAVVKVLGDRGASV